jgi:lipopolysaccharide export system protein LptC
MNRMVSTRPGDLAAPSFMGAGRSDSDSDRAFANARRHSRRVRQMRIFIPVGVGVGVVVVALMTFFNPARLLMYKLPADLGNLVISGSKITMESPRLAGFTSDARGYEVSAKAAAQDLANPDIVELKELRAKLDMKDDSEVELLALGGVYNTKSEMLTLGPNIRLSSSTGYEARLAEAVIDIRKGNIVSDKPVEVDLLKGHLNANRLEVLNAGELLRFGGGVSMTLMLHASEDKAEGRTENSANAQEAAAQPDERNR